MTIEWLIAFLVGLAIGLAVMQAKVAKLQGQFAQVLHAALHADERIISMAKALLNADGALEFCEFRSSDPVRSRAAEARHSIARMTPTKQQIAKHESARQQMLQRFGLIEGTNDDS